MNQCLKKIICMFVYAQGVLISLHFCCFTEKYRKCESFRETRILILLKRHKLKTKSSIASPEVNFGLKEERRHKSVKAYKF